MKLDVKQVKSRYEQLLGERVTWESHWQELADYVLPRKNEIQRTNTPGEKRNLKLFDSTAQQSNELLAGALHGMLTSPSMIFFGLSSGDPAIDERDDVRKFFAESTRRIHQVLNNSNFQTEMHEVYLDLACFGTATMIIEEDDRDLIRFSARQIKEIFVAENNKGVIDEVYRMFKWDAKQIAQEFGEANLHRDVEEALKKGDGKKFCIIHAVYPMELNVETKVFKYHSQYMLLEQCHMLSEGKMRQFPYIVSRWSKGSGEIYGRSPAMTALPDVKMINEVMKTVIRGAQKTVDPPLMLPDDGMVLPIITKPGGLNYYRAGTGDRIEPFGNDARVDFGFQMLDDMRLRIRQAFYIDQLQLNQGPQMTATEVMQRTEEKMRLLGPMLGRQQSELLRPMIDRIFDVMLKKNVIEADEIPPVLSGRKLDVQYSSLIAKAQKSADVQGVLRTLEAVAGIAQFDPSALDNFDANKIVRHIAKLTDIPQELLRDNREIQQMRESRAQQQQQMMQQQQQGMALDNVQKAADATNKLRQ